MPPISNRLEEADPSDLIEVKGWHVVVVLGVVAVLIIGVVALEI